MDLMPPIEASKEWILAPQFMSPLMPIQWPYVERGGEKKWKVWSLRSFHGNSEITSLHNGNNEIYYTQYTNHFLKSASICPTICVTSKVHSLECHRACHSQGANRWLDLPGGPIGWDGMGFSPLIFQEPIGGHGGMEPKVTCWKFRFFFGEKKSSQYGFLIKLHGFLLATKNVLKLMGIYL